MLQSSIAHRFECLHGASHTAEVNRVLNQVGSVQRRRLIALLFPVRKRHRCAGRERYGVAGLVELSFGNATQHQPLDRGGVYRGSLDPRDDPTPFGPALSWKGKAIGRVRE
jgi:hypothetical protein